MYMRARKHPKPNEGKTRRKQFTALKTAGKALGALFVGGSIITSLTVKGQTADNAKSPAPANPKHKLEIAAVDNDKLPKNTKIYPAQAADGKDTAERALAVRKVDLETKPEAKKAEIEPGSAPNQKWCDGIEIKDGEIIFKGMTFGSRTGSSPIMSEKAMEIMKKVGADYTKATNENLRFFDQRIDGNLYRAYLIVEIPVIRENYPLGETETSMIFVELNRNDDNVFVRPVSFGTKVFPGSVYIGKRGEFVAATQDCIEIVEPGIKGKKTNVSLSKLIGGDAPFMENPKISEENGWYTITDPVIKNTKGERMKVVFKVMPEEDKFVSGIISEKEITPVDY